MAIGPAYRVKMLQGLAARILAAEARSARTLASAGTRASVRSASRRAATGGPDFVYRGRFRSGGKFLFVPHPDCCPKCNLLGLTPHFFNTPDVAFISHPNCKCATVEAPAGLSPSQLMEWARNPVGPMRYGFNYGIPLQSFNLTERNRENRMLAFGNRMRPFVSLADRNRRRVRAEVTAARVEEVRRRVAEGSLGPARDFTRGIKTLATKEAKRRAAMESQNGRKRKAAERPRKVRGMPKTGNRGKAAESARVRASKKWKSGRKP